MHRRRDRGFRSRVARYSTKTCVNHITADQRAPDVRIVHLGEPAVSLVLLA